MLGGPTIWITVGQGPTALAVGFVWTFLLSSILSFLFLLSFLSISLLETVLGKISVPGRPTSMDDSRARAYCACSRCGWGLFGHFFSHISFLFSFSLSLGDGPI